jgi:hypothetical protein
MVHMGDRPARARREGAAALATDDARLAMMRRVKRMTLDERIELFERLARDAAWARGARRVR